LEENSPIMGVCGAPRILMCEHQSFGFVGWESVSADVAERTVGRLKRPADRPTRFAEYRSASQRRQQRGQARGPRPPRKKRLPAYGKGLFSMDRSGRRTTKARRTIDAAPKAKIAPGALRGQRTANARATTEIGPANVVGNAAWTPRLRRL
jgi:hypothetical protein